MGFSDALFELMLLASVCQFFRFYNGNNISFLYLSRCVLDQLQHTHLRGMMKKVKCALPFSRNFNLLRGSFFMLYPVEWKAMKSSNLCILWSCQDGMGQQKKIMTVVLTRFVDLGPPFRRSAIPGVRHSGGPPFRKSAIPEVCHSRGLPRQDAMGNRRLGPLDWINCYFLILYFMDFPPFLLLRP